MERKPEDRRTDDIISNVFWNNIDNELKKRGWSMAYVERKMGYNNGVLRMAKHTKASLTLEPILKFSLLLNENPCALCGIDDERLDSRQDRRAAANMNRNASCDILEKFVCLDAFQKDSILMHALSYEKSLQKGIDLSDLDSIGRDLPPMVAFAVIPSREMKDENRKEWKLWVHEKHKAIGERLLSEMGKRNITRHRLSKMVGVSYSGLCGIFKNLEDLGDRSWVSFGFINQCLDAMDIDKSGFYSSILRRDQDRFASASTSCILNNQPEPKAMEKAEDVMKWRKLKGLLAYMGNAQQECLLWHIELLMIGDGQESEEARPGSEDDPLA